MNKDKRNFYGFEMPGELKQRMERVKKEGFPLTPEMYRSFTEAEVLKREKLLNLTH